MPETERDGREIYERVIGRVRHNTGGYQPPIHRQEPIVNGVARDTYKGDWVRDAIRKAMDDFELVRINDAGQQYLAVADRADLRERLESYTERRDDPNQELIGLTNMLLQKMEGAGYE